MSWRRDPVTGRCNSRRQPAPHTTPVVVIDEDDDDDDVDDLALDSEVFIIDDEEEIARATAACNSKKGNSSSSNVINIDDDDDDGEEEDEGHRAGPSMAGDGSPAATTPPVCARNRYGLDYVYDSEQSDLSGGSDSESDGDGSSDCEILDDTGTARKVWEKAASRRTTLHHPPHGKDGRASTSPSSAESSTHYDETPENLFTPVCPLDDDILRYFRDAFNPAGQSSTNGAKHGAGPSSVPNAQEGPMDIDSHGKETEDHDPACSSDPDMPYKGPLPEKAQERSHHPHLDETLRPEGYTSCSFVSPNRVFPAYSSADCKGDSPIFISTPERMDEKIAEGISLAKDGRSAHSEAAKQKKKMCFTPGADDSCMDQLTEDAVFTGLRQSGEYFNKNAPTNEASGTCSLPQKDLVKDPEKLGQSSMVIGCREKHKESDEYKRAQEEEWASRQRQLAIQAEEAKEAKRLRKRKKAEALRLVDMEKRQKQRLEEVRETQRKSEETIQLKEQCLGAVRLELEIIERRYTDMASILRALGIPVEGGEVKAAYKQALLKFHPDRVSRNDIYEQVKAEETFKFISRFKEKLRL
ncbi:hypothetical protein D1007_05288 [Hordeum vulgare]|uniref:J domain-containing protein n=1 Tax=Hordeum vulgare subsp. vulgare TaxID=112509 RepID=A0A8I6YLI2_HORVV|nr:bifunctional lysine-specific demethylase and histidyl-hydroxylase NO66 [Hordeum vulgare subsp. vulgare]KAE8817084.1 hypothetical protein D1007_05288 [Hordeum vulgare]